MLKRKIRGALESLGLRKPKAPRPMGYDLEAEAMALVPVVRPFTMIPLPRLITLHQQVRYCDTAGIPGAFVECGVWKGGSVGMMALSNLRHGAARRDLHLFDAFTEICEPDEKVDGARAVQEVRAWTKQEGGTEGRLKPLTGIYDAFGGPGTLAENQRLLEEAIGYDKARIHYHQGWFQDTLPTDAAAIGPIALLRLDGDWYASTKVCLEHLYDQVVSGGVIIVDDYGTYEGCRKAVDEFLGARGVKAYLGHVDADCRYWIKV
jgi:hypothetical protein